MRESLLRILFGNPLYDASLGAKAPTAVVDGGGSLLSVHAAQLADNLVDFSSGLGNGADLGRDAAFRALPLMMPDAARAAVLPALCDLAHWSANAWRPDILGERTARLIGAYGIIATGAPEEARQEVGRQLLRGARHLHRVPISAPRPWRRFLAHLGRVQSSVALRELGSKLQKDLRALGTDVDRQIMGDGGHIERSPTKALAVLAILIEIRDALIHHQIEPPQGLVSAIDRMAPYVRALRMGDGGFTLLGGGRAGHDDLIEQVLAASGNQGRAMSHAPHVGYCRLRAGQTTLLVDVGSAASDPVAHRSPLAFELGIGKMRVVTSCGVQRADLPGGDAWAAALRGTAAHSGLIVADHDAEPTLVRAERRDHEGARLLEGWHDGYEKVFGIRHHRALYLDAGGGDLRGEDKLAGGNPAPFAIRFHLHPDVAAVPLEGGNEALIRLPRGPGWHFRCDRPITVEDSVYFGDGTRHRAPQIVVAGMHGGGETVVKWRLAMDR